MKTKFVIACCVFSLVLPSFARAESPIDIANRLIVELQKKQSLDPVIEQVDWQGAYEKMDPEQKKQMGIKSPEDLKALQVENYRGIGGKMKGSLEKAFNSAPPDQAALLKVMNDRLDSSLAEQKKKSEENFRQTSYSLGEAHVGENDAQIEVVKTVGERVTTSTLEFVKVKGDWKLKSAAPLSPDATTSDTGGPGNLLGPSIASPNTALIRLY